MSESLREMAREAREEHKRGETEEFPVAPWLPICPSCASLKFARTLRRKTDTYLWTCRNLECGLRVPFGHLVAQEDQEATLKLMPHLWEIERRREKLERGLRGIADAAEPYALPDPVVAAIGAAF